MRHTVLARGVAAVAVAAGAIGIGPALAGASPDTITRGEAWALFQATRQYADPDVAIADGYVPTDDCSEMPGTGAMGYHYVNPSLVADVAIDLERPEVLLYEKRSDGSMHLTGVEYFRVDADQRLDTDYDRPELFGKGFEGPMLGHTTDMPIHYDRHVWLYKHNPDGILADWNPRVSCPVSDEVEYHAAE